MSGSAACSSSITARPRNPSAEFSHTTGLPTSSGKAPAGRSLRNAWTLLASILESAVEYGYLPTNPARGVKFPLKPAEAEARDNRRGKSLRLLRHLGEPYRTMVSMIAATGLRIGELLALRWSSLDLEARTLAVPNQCSRVSSRCRKRKRAQRTIPLGPRAVKVLRQHRDRSSRTEPGNLVFINRKGQPFRESKLLTRVLQPAAHRGGIRARDVASVPPHSSVADVTDLKVPVKIAQEQLGHASISTTLNIYTHVVDASHRSAVEAVEERFSSIWTRMVSNWRRRSKALRPQVAVLTEFRIGGAARI